MTSPPGVSARQSARAPQTLPKFMPPVMLDSSAPHPYLPFQPDSAQFIIQPKGSQPPVASSRDSTPRIPKDILVAAKNGHLEWVKRHSAAGQTEMTDTMGEVREILSCFPSQPRTLTLPFV